MQFRFSKYRLVLGTVFLSLVGTLAYTQTEVRIRELTEVTADGISSDGAVWFGVDKTDVPASRKISLAELKKTGVQVINVKQYGATGDGVADDTEEIQAALDASNGATVFFPEGEYYCNARLYMDNDSYTLIGDKAQITLGAFLDDYNFLQNRNNTTPVESFTCIGLTFDDTANGSAAWKSVISIEKCGHTHIERCVFVDTSTTCIQIGSRAITMVAGTQGDVVITKCRAYNTNPNTHTASNFAKIEAAETLLFTENIIADFARGFTLELANEVIGFDAVICNNNEFLNSKVGSKSATQTAIPIHVNCQYATNFINLLNIQNNQVRGTDLTGTASQGFCLMVSSAADGQILSANINGNTFDDTTMGHIANFSYLSYVDDLVNFIYSNNIFTNVSYTTYTVTADTSDVLTAVGHAFTDTTTVVLSSTGTLPAGLSPLTVYYVRDRSGDTFKLAATEGGAAIDVTDTGSGTHSIHSVYRGVVFNSSSVGVISNNVIVGQFDRGLWLNTTTYSNVIGNLFSGVFSSGGEIVPSTATGTNFTGNYSAGSVVN